MRVTAELCREQERIQRAKAENEPLENRKKIALDAAKAWATEAVLAEKRDLKQSALDQLDAEIAREFARETVSDAEK
jgi:hypothetical protein